MSLARVSILTLSRHSLFTKRAPTKVTSLPSIVSLTYTWRRQCRQILLIITDKLLICLSNACIRTLVTQMHTSISAKSMSMASESTRISPQLSDITSKCNIINPFRKAAGRVRQNLSGSVEISFTQARVAVKEIKLRPTSATSKPHHSEIMKPPIVSV